MTDLETIIRSQLHDRLDDLEPSPLTTQRAVRGGQRARRRRTAIISGAAVLALLACTVTGAALLRGGSDRRDSVVAASGLGDRTVTYAEQFRHGDFASIRADMTPDVRSQLSEKQLRDTWQLALDDLGPLVRITPAVLETKNPATYLMPLHFRNGDANMRVTYQDDGAVIGITLLNAQVEKLTTVPADLAASSRQIVEDLAKGRYDSVRSRFDDRMTELLSVAQLREGWQSKAVREHGGFISTGGMTATRVPGGTVVDVFCTMQRGELRVRISFDNTGAVSGLLLQNP